MRYPDKTCAECGRQFTPRLPNKQKCCSKPCADRMAHRAAMLKRTACCKRCGIQYHPKASDRLTYCSRECSAAQRIDDMRLKREALRLKRKLSRLFSQLRQCKACKAAFVARNNQVTCGNRLCKRLVRLANVGQPIDKRCKVCGEPVAVVSRNRCPLCTSCRANAVRIRRRREKRLRERRATFVTAKHRTAEVLKGLAVMIQQAGNRCPCCGLLMTKAIDPNNDRALQIDHAVPLSKGGSDLFPNLRPLCRRCNLLKSDFVAPDIVIGEWMKQEATA